MGRGRGSYSLGHKSWEVAGQDLRNRHTEGEGARGEMECWRRVSGESAGMAEALGYEGERSEGGEGYLEEGNG
ncbi:hypothetical protein E2C01_004429 [Portunus trituberculatus]|uniref:Uncharacterized protein n=1 Tax=Portunus trituberculatus TaxID=210409 RepID=A0A5B7CSZ0_PORTR|nr:hypothetical protein [Portunus trituberculatus]